MKKLSGIEKVFGDLVLIIRQVTHFDGGVLNYGSA